MALILVLAALVACAFKFVPSEPTLHPPSPDTLVRVRAEFNQGQHQGLAALGVLLGLGALGCAFVVWPRAVAGLRQAVKEEASPAPSPSEGSPPKEEPGSARPLSLGLGVFLLGCGVAMVIQVGFISALGAGGLTLQVGSEAAREVPLAGLAVVVSGSELRLTAPLEGGDPPPGGVLVRGKSVQASASVRHALWLSADVPQAAPPTSASATLLPPGRTGQVTPGDTLWVGEHAIRIEGPGLRPMLKGSVIGGLLGVLAIAFMLGVIGRTGCDDPLRGLAAAGLTPRGALREVGRGLAGYLAVVPLMFAAIQLTQLAADALGVPAGHHPLVSALQRDPGLALWIVLSAAFVAPLLEELQFRGLALSGFRQALGPLAALCAQALIFAAIHPGLSHLLPMFVFGFALGVLRVTSPTGSLIAPITAHMAHNGLTLGFVLWVIA